MAPLEQEFHWWNQRRCCFSSTHCSFSQQAFKHLLCTQVFCLSEALSLGETCFLRAQGHVYPPQHRSIGTRYTLPTALTASPAWGHMACAPQCSTMGGSQAEGAKVTALTAFLSSPSLPQNNSHLQTESQGRRHGKTMTRAGSPQSSMSSRNQTAPELGPVLPAFTDYTWVTRQEKSQPKSQWPGYC